MSLFGAKKTTTFQKALERAKNAESSMQSGSEKSVSSGIGAQMKIARDLQDQDPDGTATTSEIAREELGEYLGVQQAAVTLTRE